MKKDVYAILLAGGKGSRLWPLSTGNYSKSFVRIASKKPLITETIERLKGIIGKKNIIIVVDKRQARLIRKFAGGIPKRNIIVEPFGRSTASAVGLAAINLGPKSVMAILPTDALIKDPRAFTKTIKSAVSFARKNAALLCVGIKPRSASSAYGYIKVKSRPKGNIYSVDKFIEKPSVKKAAGLIKNKNCLWNAGMFVFKAEDILEAMRKHAPSLYRRLQRIKMRNCSKQAAYAKMKNVSIDYQVIEKAKNLYCVKGNFSWSDLGSWNSLEALGLKPDKNKNISFGKTTLINTYNSIVYNTEKENLGVVGLRGMIVARTKNGTLICDKKDAEKVKKLTGKL
ncbi:MAG: mannose-1-phosphate guanylyltransferase [Candidatus Omnitrophica bacterium]|nr:mannose-1-phosphate guanylyltransferase [Candidatus Omnitrophota bacterium]